MAKKVITVDTARKKEKETSLQIPEEIWNATPEINVDEETSYNREGE